MFLGTFIVTLNERNIGACLSSLNQQEPLCTTAFEHEIKSCSVKAPVEISDQLHRQILTRPELGKLP